MRDSEAAATGSALKRLLDGASLFITGSRLVALPASDAERRTDACAAAGAAADDAAAAWCELAMLAASGGVCVTEEICKRGFEADSGSGGREREPPLLLPLDCVELVCSAAERICICICCLGVSCICDDDVAAVCSEAG